MKILSKTGIVIICILYGIIFKSCKKDEVPFLTTSAITEITTSSASGGGSISSDGGAEISARGVCWSVKEDPTISDSKTNDGTGTGQFVSILNGLSAGSTYHVRAYATNSAGTGYGADLTFTTLGQVPEALTQSATNISSTGATLVGTVNANYLSTVVTFEYGTTTSYGQTINATQSPVTGNSLINVMAEAPGLTEGTTYHFRIKTENSLGITLGNDMIFTTLGQVPTASTLSACCLSASGAKLNGTVNANYASTTVTFEYGTTTEYTNSVPAAQSPVSGNISTSVSANISGLNSGTTYHFRIKASNSLGTTYGDDVTFITFLTDSDGNVYQYSKIGTQVWMRENLKTTRYNDGTDIPVVADQTAWSALTSPAYSWYNNDADTYKNVYGSLYNWYAVNTGKLCPAGWHVPSFSEWLALMTFLGGGNEANGRQTGGKLLKESGTSHWNNPNYATDQYGYKALPGGFRSDDGSFFYINTFGIWWASGLWWAGGDNGTNFTMTNDSEGVSYGVAAKNTGASIRCLKD